MKCQEAKQLVFTYLDGCLDSQVESEFLTHLSHCTSCQNELESARKLNSLLAKSCTIVQPPADFVSQVMGRIEEFEKSKQTAQAKVIPMPTRAKPKTVLEKLSQNGFRFTKVASVAALVAALGAFVAFGKLPEITKMADLGGKRNESSLTEQEKQPATVLADNTGQKLTPEQTKPGPDSEQVDGEPVEQLPGSNEESLPEQTGADANNETKPVEIPSTSKGNPKAEEQAGHQEETIPDLPRLDGPFRQVTGITSVVAKSVSLTPISQDSNYVSLKPAWDERSRRVYYFSNQEASEGYYSLWVKDLKDSTVEVVARNVTKNVNADKPSTKSPDGKYMLYQEDGQVFVSRLDGSEARPLTPKLESASFAYAWRPDGTSVAISVKGTESQGLWLADAGGNSWSFITANGGGTSLSWSPDGRKIAFTDTDNMIYVGILVDENKTNLLMVVPEGDKQGDVTLAWSPDSQKLLFDWAKDGSNRGVYLATIPQ